MTWAKVCDTLHSHPKVIKAGDEAMGLWVRALSYCAQYATDGKVSRETLRRLCDDTRDARRATQKLLAAGLWETDGDGWKFHDYLDYNPSRQSLIAERNAKSEAGRATAARRWGAVAPAIAQATVPATAPAIGIGDAPDPVPSRTHKGEREEIPTSLTLVGVDGSVNFAKKRKATKAQAMPTGDHAAVIARHAELYEKARGKPPIVNAKIGGKDAKELLEMMPVAEVLAMLDAAFAEPWWVNSGGSLRSLAMDPNKFRGNRTALPSNLRHMVQPVPPEGRAWISGDGT